MAQTISGAANMSAVTVRTYNNSGEYSSSTFRVGYNNNVTNHRFKIFFTPSVTLSKVSFKLQAASYTNPYAKNCSYELENVATGEIYADSTFYWAGTGADNAKTLTFNRTFNAGTQYSLYIGPPWDEYNMHISTNASFITITSTVATYTVSYNANGGTGAPGSQTKTHGTALTLSSTTPTKASTTATGHEVTFNANGGTTTKGSATATDTTEYTFSSWNTKSDGSGTSYASGGSYTANATATLYAQYTGTTTKGAVTLPTAAECTRPGYDLLGFATSADAAAAAYAPGASYTASAAVTLYAVWKSRGLTYIDNGTSFEAHQVFIEDGSAFAQYAPYVDNGTTWEEMS